jgi:cytochrome c-type biogenesis protein CcmH/NrfG
MGDPIMTVMPISIAIGTTAIVFAAVLLALRVTVRGRQPAMLLAQRWTEVPLPVSGFILALLSTVALVSLLGVEDRNQAGADSLGFHSTDTPETASGEGIDDGAWSALRAYATNLGKDGRSEAPSANTPSATLPDVDTMIAQLVARLEKEPNDVKGWKMLGWSYLNIGQPAEATKAYETALKLEPGDMEIRKALDMAQTARPPNSP